MTHAIRPLKTPLEKRADEHQSAAAIGRLVAAALVLTQPLVVAVAVTAGLLLVRQRRVTARAYLPVAIAIGVIAIVATTSRYLRPFSEVRATVSAHAAGGPAALRGALGELTAARLGEWLGDLLPFAVGVGIALGACWAAWRSRRTAAWRQQGEHDAPVTAARLAKALRQLPRWPRLVTGRNGVPWSIRDQRILLGVRSTGTPQPYALTVGELGGHGYVDGPTGFGKTNFLIEVASGVIEAPAVQEARCPLVFITLKPSADVTDALRRMAHSTGRGFHRITQDGTGDRFDALAGQSPMEIASSVLAVLEHSKTGGFTEPHHRDSGDRYLKLASRALVELAAQDSDRRIDFGHLARLMWPSAISALQDRLSPELRGQWLAYEAELQAVPGLASSISGLRQRIANIGEGGAVDTLRAEHPAVAMTPAIEAGDVVLFDLSHGRDATASEALGNLALRAVASSLTRLDEAGWQYWRNADGSPRRDRDGELVQRRHCQVVLDEFSALGGALVIDLYERARGYGAGILLATQSATSLDEVSPSFAGRVFTNATVQAFHRQPYDAERVAGMIGTHEALEETFQTFEDGSLLAPNVYKSGQGNLRAVRQFNVAPDTLRGLNIGEVVIRVLTRTREVPERVQVRRTLAARGLDAADRPLAPEAAPPADSEAPGNPWLAAANPPTGSAIADSEVVDSTVRATPRPARRAAPPTRAARDRVRNAVGPTRGGASPANASPLSPDSTDPGSGAEWGWGPPAQDERPVSRTTPSVGAGAPVESDWGWTDP